MTTYKAMYYIIYKEPNNRVPSIHRCLIDIENDRTTGPRLNKLNGTTLSDNPTPEEQEDFGWFVKLLEGCEPQEWPLQFTTIYPTSLVYIQADVEPEVYANTDVEAPPVKKRRGSLANISKESESNNG